MRRFFNWLASFVTGRSDAQKALPAPEAPDLKKEWTSVAGYDIRLMNGEPLILLESKYPTGKGKNEKGEEIKFNGSVYNLPTYKSFLLAMHKYGHKMTYEREAFAKLVEAAKDKSYGDYQVRLLQNELGVVWRRTAGQLVGTLTENTGAYFANPGFTTMGHSQLVKYVEELKAANLDTGFEEGMLTSINNILEHIKTMPLEELEKAQQPVTEQPQQTEAQTTPVGETPAVVEAPVETPVVEAPAIEEKKEEAAAPAPVPAAPVPPRPSTPAPGL